jgi:hypothetical protein
MLLVKMLYIEDVLGDPIMQESVVGERDATAQRMSRTARQSWRR